MIRPSRVASRRAGLLNRTTDNHVPPVAQVCFGARARVYNANEAFSTSHVAPLSRMQLIGRMVAQPEVRESRNGKEYLRYVVATNDPLGPPNEDGSPAQPTSSFHSIFVFGENNVNRVRNLPKGYVMSKLTSALVFVEADFQIERELIEGTDNFRDNFFVHHRACLSDPRQCPRSCALSQPRELRIRVYQLAIGIDPDTQRVSGPGTFLRTVKPVGRYISFNECMDRLVTHPVAAVSCLHGVLGLQAPSVHNIPAGRATRGTREQLNIGIDERVPVALPSAQFIIDRLHHTGRIHDASLLDAPR